MYPLSENTFALSEISLHLSQHNSCHRSLQTLLLFQSLLSRCQHLDNSQPNFGMSARLPFVEDGTNKIFTFQAQWLDPIDMRNGNRSETIGDHWISMHIGSFIVDLNHLSRICIIIHNHASISNHGYPANFTGMKPAYMNMGSHPIAEFEIEMSNIVNVRLEMCVSLHFDLYRHLAEQIQQDRDIVRS